MSQPPADSDKSEVATNFQKCENDYEAAWKEYDKAAKTREFKESKVAIELLERENALERLLEKWDVDKDERKSSKLATMLLGLNWTMIFSTLLASSLAASISRFRFTTA